jgi:hypothetical protein
MNVWNPERQWLFHAALFWMQNFYFEKSQELKGQSEKF